MSKEKETYELEAFCSNCGWKGKKQFEKGYKPFLSDCECPNCGVRDLMFGKDPKLGKTWISL